MIEDFNKYVLPKRRKRPPLEGPYKPWKNTPKPYIPQNIFCSCGYDTGLPSTGFLMVIPPEGLKCPKCGNTILQGNRAWM